MQTLRTYYCLTVCVSKQPHRCGVWTTEGESDVNCPQDVEHEERATIGRYLLLVGLEIPRTHSASQELLLCPHTHSLLWN